MQKKNTGMDRRSFLKGGTIALAGLAASATGSAEAAKGGQSLQVWSCGGLAEAFVPANEAFEAATGNHISYTGAFAAALGKSLLAGGQTEVFAPRVLALAKKLKAQGKMINFQPLCFTKYVLITQADNPKNIKTIEDLKRSDVVCQFSPQSSPPGGKAVMGVLKKSGVIKEASSNAGMMGSCVQHDIAAVADGTYDASVVEMRITKLPRYKDVFKVIDIPEKFFPAAPIPFTIGVMKFAKDKDLAHNFVDFIRGEVGQACFEAAGFIHARSDEGRRLVEKYGVNDG